MSWFAAPLGLIALAAVPAVVALHLFRRRHREVRVSALFLWDDPETAESAGRVRHPLRRTPSFWLEVLAALLAALFIAGFDPVPARQLVHRVAVLDDSASMQAAGLDGLSAADRVRERLIEELRATGRETRVSVILTGRRPRVLCGPGALLLEAERVLAEWIPEAPAHTPGSALELATELAGEGEVWFYTDGLGAALERRPDNVRVVALGEAAPNLALRELRRAVSAADASVHEVSCSIQSYASRPRTVQFRVRAGPEELVAREYALAPGSRQSVAFDVPAAAPALTLELSGDALDLDDRAVLHPQPVREVRLAVALGEELAARLGLRGLGSTFPGVVVAAALEDADLVIAHAPAPGTWSLVLPDGSGAGGVETYAGPFLLEKRHPLLDGLTLEGVLWSRAAGFDTPGLPLLSAGDQPLLSTVVREGSAAYYLNLVAERSTLTTSPDWPIALVNLVEMRRRSLAGPLAVNLSAGEPFEYVCEGFAHVELLQDGRVVLELDAVDRVVLEDLPPAPDYRLVDTGETVARFAVNFVDPAESDLRDRGRGELEAVAGESVLARERYAASGFGRLLLCVLLLAVVADWLVLRHRGRA